MTDLNIDAQQALASVKFADLKKKVNAGSWNNNMEILIKRWGEKSAGLRFMHDSSAGMWKSFSNKLSLWSICMTTIASGVSLIAASIEDQYIKNIILYVVGGIGIVSGGLQSMKKFYNAEEKAADHNAIARQFGSFYRYITLQMTLSRFDRLPSDQLSEYALKEFERLQQDAPTLGGKQIKLYNEKFKNSEQAKPDVCEDSYKIKVYTEEAKPILIKKVELEKLNEESNNQEISNQN